MKIQPTTPAPAAIAAAPSPATGKWRQVNVLLLSLLQLFGKLRWGAPDRVTFRAILQRLWKISPYLVIIALPGSLLMLPVLAWWLNRRRVGKRVVPAAAS